MSKCRTAGPLSAIAILAFVASPHSADATVIIKTFRFSICVTGEKHPDGCKNAHADRTSSSPIVRWRIWMGKSVRARPSWRIPGPASPPRANQRITGAVIRMKRLRSRTCNGR
jgi:hypothetical protein